MNIYRKSIMLCDSIVKMSHNLIRHFIVRKNFEAPGIAKYIVFLTTYDKRINTVYLTIESLINQSRCPDKIYLWLSEEDCNPEHLPKSLERLISRGLEVRFVKSNYKSYKKLSHIFDEFALSDKEPELIVTADDDILYPTWWFEKLLSKHIEYPNDVICYRGHDLIKSSQGEYNYNSSIGNNTSYSDGAVDLIPTGVSGVLYPFKVIDLHVSDFPNITRLAPHMDDIWYKAMTRKKNIISRRVFEENIHFSPILSTLSSGLFINNVNANDNDKVINDVFDFFNNIEEGKNE